MKKLTILLVVLLMVAPLCFVACNGSGPYDKITNSCAFNLANYKDKSYFKDGVALVTVASYTDGDTTLFNSVNDSGYINIRYYSIDTPEITSKVEKWGKAASNFTNERLADAEEIVLESTTGGAPDKDSTSGRWLGYVWYKPKGGSFKLLNLELVENGLADCKASSGDKYYSYFTQALNFAKKNKLCIHGDDDDPLYNTDAIVTTLKDIVLNPDMYYDAETDMGAKVQIEAYLISYTNEGTWRSFVAAQYDEATGEVHKLNVFLGTTTASGNSMNVGDMYRLVGVIGMRSGALQIKDIDYVSNLNYATKDKSILSQANYYLTFNSSLSLYSQLVKNTYTDVTVTGTPTVTDGILTFTGTATNRTADGTDGDPVTFTFTVAVEQGYNAATLAGKTLSLTGLQLVKDSGKITIVDYRDIVIK